MSALIIWVMGAALLLINIMLRTRILRLEARLKELSNPKSRWHFCVHKPHKKRKLPPSKHYENSILKSH
ncbi:hypothetical protein [Psychrobacter immobilis]|uniref:hypothetical protein n=1 Tax=Psychrobacter immobilis TaxID=498 RepID=UPI001D100140|nr:hypothetical protein [Psychrobacter immobilis]